MNDRHPSGSSIPTAPAPDASYTPYYGAYDDQQGAQPGQAGPDGYPTGGYDQFGGDAFHGTEGYPAGGYEPGGYDTTAAYGTGTHDPHTYDTGQWDASGQWDLGAAAQQAVGHDTGGYPVAGYGTDGLGADSFGTGTHDSGSFTTGSFPTGAFDTGAFDTGTFGTGTFGTGAFDGTAALADDGFGTAPFDNGGYDTGGFATADFGSADQDGTAYRTGGYATTAMWGDSDCLQPGDAAQGAGLTASIPAQQTTDATGPWDPAGHPVDADPAGTGRWDTADQWGTDAGWDTTGVHGAVGVDTGQTQTWDATAWASGDSLYEPHAAGPSHDYAADHAGEHPAEADYTGYDGYADYEGFEDSTGGEGPDGIAGPGGPDAEAGPDGEHPAHHFPADSAGDPDGHRTDASGEPGDADDEPVLLATGPRRETARARRGGRRPGNRTASRPKRSALLTVAVPSVAIMGVTAVAAAAVGGMGGDDGGKDDSTTQAAPDAASVKPSVANSKLDTQLAGLSDRADDFADRASRTQERIDLKERQAAERKRKAEEAARKEALRPKFALPVAQHGLSAQYGQSGLNWMSLHTGIDFPVGYGTPVMAATDGTVRTQWNNAYGNMAIVTSPDGTETWYCHLSTTRIRSGSVKAGDVIAYSGDSGNSTGPHLHFEVRPGGGSAIDPLTWLRSHGLDPT
ncbi:peptidoglycan DD-metalloendopeptidase family protein [Streptomyces sp. NPDC018031]|uniref:peptidoglycan DD-metalloendopeptidase family protein n=1 Tax=Streptomyces sp. NPDC018031 TaxID=3365033 RepID=UPI0037BB11CF